MADNINGIPFSSGETYVDTYVKTHNVTHH